MSSDAELDEEDTTRSGSRESTAGRWLTDARRAGRGSKLVEGDGGAEMDARKVIAAGRPMYVRSLSSGRAGPLAPLRRDWIDDDEPRRLRPIEGRGGRGERIHELRSSWRMVGGTRVD